MIHIPHSPRYFGCISRAGHYVWRSESASASDCEWLNYLDGLLPPEGPQTEGVARLHHFNGCTLLAFWDRSVDTRPGSNSVFLVAGRVSFGLAVDMAQKAFPNVWKRYTFEVRRENTMPNPCRLTVRWITTDAFPHARVVLGNDPPRWDFEITSSWPIPHVETSDDLAVEIDHLREGIKFAYPSDQLRFLAAQIRKTNVAIANAREYPWYAGGIDPYGDRALSFQCEYQGKSGAETLQMWLAEIRVEN